MRKIAKLYHTKQILHLLVLYTFSAGVGRTGTLITIDNVLEQIEKEQVVDIPGAITKIRQRRMKMVQTDVSRELVGITVSTLYVHVHLAS